MRGRVRAATWLMPAALVGLGLLGRSVADNAWTAFTRYRTPFTFINPQARPTEPLVSQVVVVLVDGLAYHASRAMPFLNELRGWGADADCRVGLPSLSLPGRAVLMTGAWQEVHGQATNFRPRPLSVEHLFQSAKRRGRRTALSAGPGPLQMFVPYVDERVIYPRLDRRESQSLARLRAELRWMGETTRALLREKRPNLFLMDYTIADEAGHEWGADSPQYREAAQAVDEEIRKLAGQVDFTRSVLVVTSDHGHTSSGGHGGAEESVLRVPLVMVGGPVRPGTRGICEQTDLAPTLAALLGVEIPASNQGRPLLEFLVLDPGQRRRILESLYAQRESFVRQYVAWVSGRSAGPPSPAPAPRAVAATEQDLLPRLRELERRAAEAKQTRLSAEARSRLSVLVALVAALLVTAFGLRALGLVSGPEAALTVLGALVAAVIYFGALVPAGLAYSFSAVNDDAALGAFFRKNMALAVAACAAAVALACAWMARRFPEAPWSDLARLSWLVTAAFCSLFLVKMAVVYWRHGVFLRWHMPEQFWTFGFYLDTLALVALGLAAPLMPVVAFGAGWLARPRLPRTGAVAGG